MRTLGLRKVMEVTRREIRLVDADALRRAVPQG
jgi:hypothetical protein